jgi:hypothetical protein
MIPGISAILNANASRLPERISGKSDIGVKTETSISTEAPFPLHVQRAPSCPFTGTPNSTQEASECLTSGDLTRCRDSIIRFVKLPAPLSVNRETYLAVMIVGMA